MIAMKDSGIQWYGEIPADWDVKRMKFTISDYKSGPFGSSLITSKLLEDGDVLVYTPEHVAKKSDFVDVNLYLPSERIEEMSQFRVNKGDVVFPIVGTLGRAMIITEDMTDGIINQRLAKFRIRENEFTERFFMWFYSQGPSCFAYIDSQSHGVAIMNITKKMLSDMPVLIPPIMEQEAISDYLDDKCGKIDEAISRHNAIIEKLEEYRKSVVTQAVTKGLNPDEKMKDSGVKWVGNINCNYTMTPIKYLFEHGQGRLKVGPYGSSMKGKTKKSGPYKVYNQAHLISGDFSLNRHFISAEDFEELSAYEILPGDILFSVMGTVGKCKFMPVGFPRGIMDSHLMKARLNKKIIPEFFEYVYDKDHSSVIISQMLEATNGSIMDGLNSEIVKTMLIPLPSIEEQHEIVKYLNGKCSKIDEAISRQNVVIAKLEEYKKSIIYAAVTGKIDCRKEES